MSDRWRDLPLHVRAILRGLEAMLRVCGWAAVFGCAGAADLLQRQREENP